MLFDSLILSLKQGKCFQFFPQAFSGYSIFHAILFFHFEFEAGKMLPIFPKKLFMIFDVLILSSKQGKMLPMFPQEIFMQFDFLTFPKKCSGYSTFDFEFETGENAAQFFPRKVSCYSTSDFEIGGNAAQFFQKTFSCYSSFRF